METLSKSSDAVATAGELIDIGGSRLPETWRQMLEEKLLREDRPGQRLLPSALLGDDTGLCIWRQITRLPHYYQTRDEIVLLEQHGSEIARHMAPGSIILDLGSGDVRKIKPLLDRLETMRKPTSYYALDLSRAALEENMRLLATPYRIGRQYQFVDCFGLWGTFDDAHDWARRKQEQRPGDHRPRWFCSLGSQFGNDHEDLAVTLLSKWARIMGPEDRMLLGQDARRDKDEIWCSYHDSFGLFEEFIRNGFRNSNRVLGSPWYRDEDWDIDGVMQDDPLMHRWVIRARRSVTDESLGLAFEAGTEVDCYQGFKYGPSAMQKLFDQAGLEVIATWKAPSSLIYEYLLRVAPDGLAATNKDTLNWA